MKMANVYKPPFCTSLAALTAAGAADAGFKAAFATTISEIRKLFNGTVVPSAHPDFNKISGATAALIDAELKGLGDAVAAHA